MLNVELGKPEFRIQKSEFRIEKRVKSRGAGADFLSSDFDLQLSFIERGKERVASF
jgi:hypothetical protein